MASSKNYTVQHTMLGTVDPESAANHTKGQVVPAEHLGDEKNIARLVKLGAIKESSREEIDAVSYTHLTLPTT